MIASEQFLKTERKANMRKIIAAACLMAAMTLCVGCSSAKDGSKDTTKATTETKMKVQSKYKVPKITAAKKTEQLADAQKGETIVTMKVKGYGEMQFKFFMKKAPLAVKNFVTLASNGYFDGQIFHRVINASSRFFMYGKFRSRYEWKSVFYRAGESRYSEERSGRRECRAHKETTSVILGSGWISILNRKLYCVWTNDQWI